MRKKIISILMTAIILITCLVAASCIQKPTDLEGFINSNDETSEQIRQAADDSGMSVEINGNEVVYTYDLSNIEAADEDTMKDPAMIEKLQESLDSMKDSFAEQCKNLETESGIKGITMVVNYKYGDEILATQTFTSAD